MFDVFTIYLIMYAYEYEYDSTVLINLIKHNSTFKLYNNTEYNATII